MSFHRRWMLAALSSVLMLIWAVGAVEAFPMTFGEIEVEAETPLPGDSIHGYVEYPIVIRNTSGSRSHTVKLTMPRESYGGGWGATLGEVARTVQVAPGATVRTALYQPNLNVNGNNLGVWIDGYRWDEAVSVMMVRRESYYYNEQVSVLFSPLVARDPIPFFAEEKSSYRREGNIGKSDIPPLAWSKNWLAYTRFEGITLTAREFEQLPADVLGALIEWVQAGGTLIVVGKRVGLDRWTAAFGSDLKNSSLFQAITTAPDPIMHQPIGFGEFAIIDQDEPTAVATETWENLEARLKSSRSAWENNRYTEPQRRFPITDNFGIPVRGLFILVLIFSLVIGPINLLVLTRMKRRIYILWTVPLISIVTCMAVFLFASFAEGWGASGRTQILTLLDETTHRAVSIGWTGIYSPLTPSDGLHYANETDLFNVRNESSRYGADGAPRYLDWTSDQHLSANWVLARLPVYFKVRKSEIRRERLALRPRPDGGMGILNGLGAQIKQLWLVDDQGRLFNGSNIEAGAEATLTQNGYIRTHHLAPNLVDLFRGDWLEKMKDLLHDVPHRLGKNTYVADLDGAPFLEAGLPSFSKNNRRNIVYGFSRRGANED